jgi:hypothetical protein
LFGYSKKSNWAFTQEINSKGELVSPDICSDAWGGDWPGITSFNIYGGSDQISGYVFGCGGSDRKIFINAFTNSGTISYETYRESTGNAYDVCCSYTIGARTYILMHDTTDYYYAIREVTEKGELDSGFIQSGKWGNAYTSVFAVQVSGNWYLGGHSKKKNKFFLQKILSNGKLDEKESYSKEWSNYYDTLIGIEVGSRAYIFGQRKSDNHWFTQEITSDGNLEKAEADNGKWGNYYATTTSANVDGNTYFIAQSDSDSKLFTQYIGSDGKFSSSESYSTKFKNFYSSFAVFKYDPPMKIDNWMTGIYDSILRTKTLKEIMMPGSHDAGMGECRDCTIKGKPGNTQTQDLKIGQQLLAGSRYFDLRPIACATGSAVSYRTGHFGEVPALGWQGCYGQSMDSICADIVEFCNGSERSKELIILKFSHYLHSKDGTIDGGWNDAQKIAFGSYLNDKIGDVMLRYSGTPRVGMLTYEQLMGLSRSSQKPKVMVVFDDINQNVRNTGAGIFRYADFPYDKSDPSFISPYVDLCVFDDYSNTDKVDHMIDEQKKLMLDPANHGGDMFLLSWTLTLQYVWYNPVQDVKTIVNDISDLALKADQRLTPSLESWMAKGEITAATLPNVLYVDYLSSQQADLCRNLLRQFYKK